MERIPWRASMRLPQLYLRNSSETALGEAKGEALGVLSAIQAGPRQFPPAVSICSFGDPLLAVKANRLIAFLYP